MQAGSRSREPARHQAQLEERLPEARLGKAPPPLADRLDVVEPPAHARYELEVGLGVADDLLLPERQERARELAAHECEIPRVGVARGVDVDLVGLDHVAPKT